MQMYFFVAKIAYLWFFWPIPVLIWVISMQWGYLGMHNYLTPCIPDSCKQTADNRFLIPRLAISTVTLAHFKSYTRTKQQQKLRRRLWLRLEATNWRLRKCVGLAWWTNKWAKTFTADPQPNTHWAQNSITNYWPLSTDADQTQNRWQSWVKAAKWETWKWFMIRDVNSSISSAACNSTQIQRKSD